MSRESYIRGFCKAAEAAGVDPVELAKYAQQYKTDGYVPEFVLANVHQVLIFLICLIMVKFLLIYLLRGLICHLLQRLSQVVTMDVCWQNLIQDSRLGMRRILMRPQKHLLR